MHVSVLLHESIDALAIQPNGIYVDATFGGGGHSREILKRLGPNGKLYAFDQDEDAADRAIDDARFVLIQENFRYVQRFLRLHGVRQINGLIADLGMSSFQLDSEDRGFSVRYDAPLDMRMNQRKSKTAQQVLNTYGQQELQLVFQNYGELRNARSLAKFITEQRSLPFETTGDFIERIDPLIKGNRNRYLAQVFQALRIEVNEEMSALEELLEQSANLIVVDGRLSVITFHSLEDRLVKRFLKTGTFNREPEKDVFGNYSKAFEEVNRKPIEPSAEEVKNNPRARSAKLRIGQRI